MNQIEEMIIRGQELLDQNLSNDNEVIIKWKSDSRRLVRTLYDKGSKQDKAMRAEDISTRLIVLKSINESEKTFESKQITYNVHGNNARINLNSVDNSNNIVNITPENLFNELRTVLQNNITDTQQRTVIIEAVNYLEEVQNTPKFIDKYQKFIGLAVNHMELITPFIPALTQMLT